MIRELTIEKAEDGYIVNMRDFSGRKHVFKTFEELEEFLRGFFDEEKKEPKP